MKGLKHKLRVYTHKHLTVGGGVGEISTDAGRAAAFSVAGSTDTAVSAATSAIARLSAGRAHTCRIADVPNGHS